jgi:hypothetical protein
MDQLIPRVAIVNYLLGNLFNVKHACEYVGMQATITSSRDAILRAGAILLPGIGAYGDAMEALHRKSSNGEVPERYFREVMDHTGMDPEYFHDLCDRFRSPHLWKNEDGVWKLRDQVS